MTAKKPALAALLCLAALPSAFAEDFGSAPDYVTPKAEILKKLDLSTPKELPPALKTGLGATHVAGRYHFTDKPFLVEGAELIDELKYPALKLWFTKPGEAYPFNSDWSSLGANPTMLEMAKHPYYEAAFALPFKVIALEVQNVRDLNKPNPPEHYIDPDSDFKEDEKQVYELATYLLQKFKDRDVTFIFQNWEGDWMFRGKARKEWLAGEFPELERRKGAFSRWFSARQRAVDKARSENPDSKCKILHAVEVNRVLDSWKGLATLTNTVLTEVPVDLVSWSCYDGLQSWKKSADTVAVGLTQGIETIQHFAKSKDGKPIPVMIGEIGIPEEKLKFTQEQADAVYNGSMAVFAAQKTPYVFLWEVYCNEIKEGLKKELRKYTAEELNGYWIKRPDGTLGFTGTYFDRLLKKE